MNKPVAYVNNMCNDSIDWKVDPISLAEGTPLYTTPQDQADRIAELENARCVACGWNPKLIEAKVRGDK